jgi:hypothetical protein
MRPEPELPQFYEYPPRGDSTVYLLTGPVTIINERPAEREEEGTLKKFLSLVVAVLNFVATIVVACVQQ